MQVDKNLIEKTKNDAKNLAEAGERLYDILKLLREFCPWDKKQNFDSLRYLTIEETYELSNAILEKNFEDCKKELGDLLMHIFFYCQIAEEEKRFNITDVVNAICNKLIFRHPHIFSEETSQGLQKVQTAEDVKANWEKIKLKEGEKHSVFSGVPKSMPSLVKASRIQEKAAGLGFDFENAEQAWQKVEEETREMLAEADKTEEFGDLLFSLVNYARKIGINPDTALEMANLKFMKRFSYIEKACQNKNLDIKSLSMDALEELWQEAKRE